MRATNAPAPPTEPPERTDAGRSALQTDSDHAGRHHYLHPANRFRHDHRSTGQRLADSVTGVFGSWRFIVIQTVIVIAWIGTNIVAVALRWDPYPFILLNLLFSTQAAYAAPLILLSQNRQADTDRVKAEHDYRINQLALQYLIAWHRSTHGDDCDCVQNAAPAVEDMLATVAHKL